MQLRAFSTSSDNRVVPTTYTCQEPEKANKRGEKEKERGRSVPTCYTSAAGAIVFWGTGAIAIRTPRVSGAFYRANAFAGLFYFRESHYANYSRVRIFGSHYTVPANSTARRDSLAGETALFDRVRVKREERERERKRKKRSPDVIFLNGPRHSSRPHVSTLLSSLFVVLNAPR